MADIPVNELNKAITSAGGDWIAAENKFTRMPEADRLRRLGVPLSLLDHSEEKEFPAVDREAVAPAAFDLRNVNGKNYVGKIKDQGNCGSCVSFGVTATIEGSACYKLGKDPARFDLSEADLYFCFGPRHGSNCDTGWIPSQALPHCANPGIVDEACFPYSDKDQPCKLCNDAANRRFRIRSSTFVTGNAAAIKNWVSQHGPVIACFVVYSDFFAYDSGIYRHVSGSESGGHCVTIVGYDDAGGYWICKNSWGEDWGERGFFRIAYGQCRIESWQNAGVSV